MFSLHGVGGHFESVFFSIAGLFCFFEVFFREGNYKMYVENSRKLVWLFILFGVISGFGVYFLYDYLIMFFTVSLFWFIFDKKFFLKRYFLVFLLGFIIGFSPRVIYNLSHNFSGLNIAGVTLFEAVFSKSIPQIFQTLSFTVIHMLPGIIWIKLYLTIAFCFSFVVFANLGSFRHLFFFRPMHLKSMKELPFIVYLLVFVLAWSIVYMPIKDEGVPLWMSGLWSRMIHGYPFLAVITEQGFAGSKR